MKHVVEVVLNTASALQSWVDKPELPGANVCDDFGMKLYCVLCELPVKQVI